MNNDLLDIFLLGLVSMFNPSLLARRRPRRPPARSNPSRPHPTVTSVRITVGLGTVKRPVPLGGLSRAGAALLAALLAATDAALAGGVERLRFPVEQIGIGTPFVVGSSSLAGSVRAGAASLSSASAHVVLRLRRSCRSTARSL